MYSSKADGHTVDNLEKLSNDRANVIVERLKNSGVPQERLKAIGKGEGSDYGGRVEIHLKPTGGLEADLEFNIEAKSPSPGRSPGSVTPSAGPMGDFEGADAVLGAATARLAQVWLLDILASWCL